LRVVKFRSQGQLYLLGYTISDEENWGQTPFIQQCLKINPIRLD